jgi:hypothetical protein
MMKTYLRLITFALVAFLCVVPAFAQSTTTQTTFAAAVSTVSETTIRVAVATGFTAGTTFAYADGELMPVTAVNGTTISVVRGGNGTMAVTHTSGAVVWVGPFTAFRPNDPRGSCTAANEIQLVQINVNTGNIFNCVNSKWQGVTWAMYFPARFPRTPVVNANYTAKLSDVLIVMTSLSGGKTVTLPTATGLDGKFYIISDESGAPSASNTLTIAGTINGASNQSIVAAYGVVRVRSNGTAWFLW